MRPDWLLTLSIRVFCAISLVPNTPNILNLLIAVSSQTNLLSYFADFTYQGIILECPAIDEATVFWKVQDKDKPLTSTLKLIWKPLLVKMGQLTK